MSQTARQTDRPSQIEWRQWTDRWLKTNCEDRQRMTDPMTQWPNDPDDPVIAQKKENWPNWRIEAKIEWQTIVTDNPVTKIDGRWPSEIVIDRQTDSYWLVTQLLIIDWRKVDWQTQWTDQWPSYWRTQAQWTNPEKDPDWPSWQWAQTGNDPIVTMVNDSPDRQTRLMTIDPIDRPSDPDPAQAQPVTAQTARQATQPSDRKPRPRRRWRASDGQWPSQASPAQTQAVDRWRMTDNGQLVVITMTDPDRPSDPVRPAQPSEGRRANDPDSDPGRPNWDRLTDPIDWAMTGRKNPDQAADSQLTKAQWPSDGQTTQTLIGQLLNPLTVLVSWWWPNYWRPSKPDGWWPMTKAEDSPGRRADWPDSGPDSDRTMTDDWWRTKAQTEPDGGRRQTGGWRMTVMTSPLKKTDSCGPRWHYWGHWPSDGWPIEGWQMTDRHDDGPVNPDQLTGRPRLTQLTDDGRANDEPSDPAQWPNWAQYWRRMVLPAHCWRSPLTMTKVGGLARLTQWPDEGNWRTEWRTDREAQRAQPDPIGWLTEETQPRQWRTHWCGQTDWASGPDPGGVTQ